MTGIEHWLLPRMGIKNPWRVKNSRPDNITLQPASKSEKLYGKPDGKLTF